jgi:hypothetical protein
MPLQCKQITPLSDNFTPNQLLARVEQLHKMFELTLVPYDNSNLWIEGDPGLGKTLTARFFMQEVENRKAGKTFYVACDRSLKNAIQDTCHSHGIEIARRSLSASSVAEELIRKYPDAPRYIFLLDEPEKVYRTAVAVSDIANFVHPLHNYMTRNGKNFNIIFISRETKLKATTYFPEDTRSRLRLQGIIFPRYMFPQIVSILSQRMALVLDSEQFERTALNVLARHIYRIGGDIRQALDILRYAIFNLATKKLTNQVMEDAVEWGKTEWWKAQLTERIPSPHWSMIAYVASQLAKKDEEGETYSVDQPVVMRGYTETMTTQGLHPLGASSVYYIIEQINKRYGFFKQKLERNGVAAKLVFDQHDREHIMKVGSAIDWTEAFAFEHPTTDPLMSATL